MQEISMYSGSGKISDAYKEMLDNLFIFDAHTHVGRDKDGVHLSAKMLLKKMDYFGVNTAIVFALNNPDDDRTFSNSNNIVFDASKTSNGRLMPFFRLNPAHPEWKEEFKRCSELGFKGVKLHPRSQRFELNGQEAKEVYAKAETNALPVLVHVGLGIEGAAEKLLEISNEFKKLRFIVGHAGYVDIFNVIKKANSMKNFYFETSTVNVFDLFQLMDEVEHKRILFGSDTPYWDMGLSLEMNIQTALSLKKSTTAIRDMLGCNILKWFQ